MSFLKKRLPKILVVIGLTFLLSLYTINLSSTLDFNYQANHNIIDDGLTSYVFKTQSNIFIQANERNGHRFSLYVFELNATSGEVNTQIDQNGTVLVAAENVTSFEGTVVIPKNGFYLMYVAPVDTIRIAVHVIVTQIGINLTIFLIGVITLCTGLIILLFNEILPVLISGPKEDAAPAGT